MKRLPAAHRLLRPLLPFVALAPVFLGPGLARAEVADKLWSAPELIIPALASALLALLLVRRSAWWCLLTLPLGLARVCGAAAECADPDLGRAIGREVGNAYLFRIAFALVVVLIGHGVAVYLNRRRASRLGAGPPSYVGAGA